MTYQAATPVAPPPYPPAPGYGYPPGPSPKRSRGGLVAGITGAILAAGLVGGGIGAFVAGRDHQVAGSTAAASTDTHAQDVQLCTAFATVNSAMPSPPSTALDVLPGVNGLRLALTDAPNADPEVRTALSALVRSYDEMIAWFGHVRSRGLAAPQPYDKTQAQQAYDHAWAICQLDK